MFKIVRTNESMLTKKNLKMMRSGFLLLAVFLLLAGLIDYVMNGIAGQNVLAILLSSMMYSASNKCENIMLRIRIDSWINENVESPIEVSTYPKEEHEINVS